MTTEQRARIHVTIDLLLRRPTSERFYLELDAREDKRIWLEQMPPAPQPLASEISSD